MVIYILFCILYFFADTAAATGNNYASYDAALYSAAAMYATGQTNSPAAG